MDLNETSRVMRQGVEMKAMAETRNLAQSIVETVAERVAEPLQVLDNMMRIRSANQAFYRVFRVNPREAEGQSLYSLSKTRWDAKVAPFQLNDLVAFLQEVLASREV
jgi:two-component system CheB/CheR fusion protein